MAVSKRYTYKVYKMGNYLGDLPTPSSEFGYTQNINTAGSQLAVTIPKSSDQITSSTSLIGHASSLIQEFNTVEVIEYSPNDVNGVTVFKGYMSTINPNFGGSEDTKILVLSNGADLDNTIVTTGESVDVSQTAQDSSFDFGATGTTYKAFIQAYTVSGGVTDVSSLDIKIRRVLANSAAGTVRVGFYPSVVNAQNDTNLMGSTTNPLVQNDVSDSAKDYNFSFSGGIPVTPGLYAFKVTTTADFSSSDAPYQLFYKNATDPVPSGDMYIQDQSNVWTTPTGDDLYFKSYSSGGGTTAVYSSDDPTDIFKSVIDNYNNQGGLVRYSSSTDNTGESVSYTFRLNTTLDAIKKCLELSPSDWYWYANPATDIIYFKQTATTATHTLVIGKDIQELDLQISTDTIRNVVYVSGGDDGTGTNILVVRTNPTSIAATGRQLLERISDSNVGDTPTAETLGDNFLARHASSTYQTPVNVLGTNLDLNDFNVGDTVRFANSKVTFINNLILQIASIERRPDFNVLTVGELPPKTTTSLEDANRAIIKLQTVNNPSSPT